MTTSAIERSNEGSRAVLVTGASTGIGRACVARLAAHDWRVYAGVRRQEDADRLRREIAGDLIPVICDVTQREDIDRTLGRIAGDVGGLDGLVNNAGIGTGGPVELWGDDEWRRLFDVNFFAVVTLTREAFLLVRAADGRFVHIGSIAGRVGSVGLAPYVASKHALEGFNWVLRQELRRDPRMHSSLVEPGLVTTAIWDKGMRVLDKFERELSADDRRRYEFILHALRGFIDEGRSKGIDPGKVAAAVEHALTARRPKARYLVGADAKVTGVLCRLPDRALEAFTAMNTARLEKAGIRLGR